VTADTTGLTDGTGTAGLAGAADVTAALGPVGLRWHDRGRAVLGGPLYGLAAGCDTAFTLLAERWRAEPEQHPPMIDVAELQAVDYLASFPQLATFPVSLDADPANLREFTGRDALDPAGAVRPARTAPIREVLTPAACYHLYPNHRGERLGGPLYLTTRNTCFRREEQYAPLRRQWSFQMREIVCMGTRAEVREFLDAGAALVRALLRELDLPIAWAAATDPFFEPARNPKYLAQRLRPTKHEALYGGDGRGGGGLAVASVNLHEDHFGAAFEIERDGVPAVTGCVAFGVERWVYALTHRHGCEPAGWPDVPAAARRVAVTGGEAKNRGEA
jgi:seryl-tRNA synthetase